MDGPYKDRAKVIYTDLRNNLIQYVLPSILFPEERISSFPLVVVIINLFFFLSSSSNVVKNYKETGYLWEQYDQKKGKGKGARLFTGWTSLIVLIMAEEYSEC